MAKVAQNFMANMAGTVVGSLIGLVAVPLYLKFVGTEGYGLIGFYTVLASLLTILDVGFSSAAARELSRTEGLDAETRAEVGDAVRVLERGFFLVAILAGAIVTALAPIIATRWINVHQIGQGAAIAAVQLMGLVLILQFPIGLYNGCLLGMQRHVVMNGINVFMGALRAAGAIAVLWLVSPSVEAFFAWQVVATLLNLVFTRNAVMKLLPAQSGPRAPRMHRLRALGRFAIGVGGINVLGLILTQLDKIVMSYVLPLAQFGYYMLAWTLSSLIYRLSGPLFNSILPRMMQLDARGEVESSQLLFRTGGQVMAVLVVPFSLFLATYSEEIMRLWTGDADAARADRWVVALMSVGTMISGTMYVPLAVQLACGSMRQLLFSYLAAVGVMASLVLPLTASAGIVGASASWAIVNVVLSAAMFLLTRSHFGKQLAMRWAIESLALPVLLAAVYLVAAKVVMGDGPISRVWLFLQLAAIGLSCEVLAAFAAPIVRRRVISNITSLWERMRA